MPLVLIVVAGAAGLKAADPLNDPVMKVSPAASVATALELIVDPEPTAPIA